MRCSSCELLLDRYSNGALSAHRMQAVRKHLETCTYCSALVTELRVVDALLSTARAPELVPNFTFALMAEVRAKPPLRSRSRSIWSALAFYLVVAWVAICALAVAFGNRFANLSALGAALRNPLAHAVGAIGGAAHALAPATPAVVGLVGGVIAVDCVLIATIIFFYTTVRPRLSARLARSEAP